jgi:hypothetical protein
MKEDQEREFLKQGRSRMEGRRKDRERDGNKKRVK